MVNEFGDTILFRVYEIVGNGSAGAEAKRFYGFIHVREFESRPDAERWVNKEGEKQTDYTIIEVIRK